MDFERHFPTFSRFLSWLRQMPGRRALTWIFAVVAIPLAARLVLDVWAARRLDATIARLEKEWGTLDPKTLEPPSVPEEENRARLLRAAAELIVRKEFPGKVGPYWPDPFQQDEVRGAEILEAMVAPNDLALTLATRARELPRSNWQVQYHQGRNAELPRLVDLMHLSKLIATKALLSTQRGKASEAVTAIESGLALADSLYREPVFIVELIAVACDRINAEALRELLARAEPRAKELERLQDLVEQSAEHRPIHDGFVGDLKMTHSEISRFVDSGWSLDPTTSPWLGSRVLAWWLRPLRLEDHRFYLESMDAQLRWSAKPAWKRRGESLSNVMTRGAPWYLFVSRQLLPNLENAVMRGDLNAARLALARTALALRRYRLDRGEYPMALDALVPTYIDSVPKDPFTGEVPEYRRDGTGFVLRSKGADMKELEWEPKRDQVLAWRIPR